MFDLGTHVITSVASSSVRELDSGQRNTVIVYPAVAPHQPCLLSFKANCHRLLTGSAY